MIYDKMKHNNNIGFYTFIGMKENALNIFEQRAALAKEIQLSPHIVDKRKMFMLHESNAWYELCLSLLRLLTVYNVTFDLFAKNAPKMFV